MKSYPEVAPTVEIGIGYAQHVSDFKLDIEGVTNHLRAKGLNDQQILDTTIVFSGEKPASMATARGAHGGYEHESRKAVIGLPDAFSPSEAVQAYKSENAHALQSRGWSAKEAQEMQRQFDSYVATEILRTTLGHELEHRVAQEDPENWQKKRRYLQGVIAKTYLAMTGVTSLPYIATNFSMRHMTDMQPDAVTAYSMTAAVAGAGAFLYGFIRNGQSQIRHQNPEEQQCIAAEASMPEGIVRVTARGNNT